MGHTVHVAEYRTMIAASEWGRITQLNAKGERHLDRYLNEGRAAIRRMCGDVRNISTEYRVRPDVLFCVEIVMQAPVV